jgi:hypothetical protein
MEHLCVLRTRFTKRACLTPLSTATTATGVDAADDDDADADDAFYFVNVTAACCSKDNPVPGLQIDGLKA